MATAERTTGRGLISRADTKPNFQPTGLRRNRHGMKPSLGLLGQAGEKHGHRVARVTIATASDDDAGEVNFSGVCGGLHRHRHLSPNRDGVFGAELDSILTDAHGVGRKIQPSGLGLDRNGF